MIFLSEATQNDHIRLLYTFENNQKKFGGVGSCEYAPASIKKKYILRKLELTYLPPLLLDYKTRNDERGALKETDR